jgi:hypothetical protein
VQIKQQAILAVEYNGGKVLQAFEGCIQPQFFALHVIAQGEGVILQGGQ